MGSKSSTPPPPDYVGAANATAAGNAEAARIAAQANRVNQITPEGSRTYTQDPNNPDQWTQTTRLSPAQQALYDQDVKIKQGLSSVSDKGLSYVQSALDSPFDKSALPASQINPGETAQAAILRRLQPQLDRSKNALYTQLVNQGLTPGSEAFNEAMDQANRQENDAISQAALQGINVGQQARQQGIQEQSFFRNEPLNMLNAVRTGQQVTNPSFSAVPQQATTAGPDILGAVNSQYGAQVANVNAQNASNAGMMGGLFSLGTAAIPFAFSDERLKYNIKKLFTLPNGVEICSFRWTPNSPHTSIGCIAQQVRQVLPEAVLEMDNGFLAVDYAKVVA